MVEDEAGGLTDWSDELELTGALEADSVVVEVGAGAAAEEEVWSLGCDAGWSLGCDAGWSLGCDAGWSLDEVEEVSAGWAEDESL